MLVLTRKLHESITIGADIRVTITQLTGNRVRLGIEAPKEFVIRRGELDPKPAEEPTETQ